MFDKCSKLCNRTFIKRKENNDMFNKKENSEVQELRRQWAWNVKELSSANEMKIRELEKTHELKLKEKEFELKHFKDEEIKKLEGVIAEMKLKCKEVETKNTMLDKMVDLNAGIIDVKKLVETLIQKIPTFDLKNLTINSNTK